LERRGGEKKGGYLFLLELSMERKKEGNGDSWTMREKGEKKIFPSTVLSGRAPLRREKVKGMHIHRKGGE